MTTIRNYSKEELVESYDIKGVSRADMYKMTETYNRVIHIIENHLDKNAKKEYISDDDLYDIAAILDVLTENNKITLTTSVFDKRKENIMKMHEQCIDAN